MRGLVRNEMGYEEEFDVTNAAILGEAPPPGSIAALRIRQAGVSTAEAPRAALTEYSPQTWQVNEATETVRGQLDRILAEESPYIQRARAGALQTANARGLLNTSMAAQAGEAAAIDAALPIASYDAQTYGLAARENMAAINAAKARNAEAANRMAIANAEMEARVALANAEAANKIALANAEAINKARQQAIDAYNQTALQGLRGEQAKILAEIEANYKLLLQTNQTAGEIFKNMMNNTTAVIMDPNTTFDIKQITLDNLTNLLQSSLTIAGATANVNLTNLLNFSGGPGALNEPIQNPTPPPPAYEPPPPWEYTLPPGI